MKNPFKKSIKKFELINAMNADSDLVAIEKIIKSNPNSVFETDIEEGYTALHYVAWDNKFDIVKLLIKSGAEIDPIGEDGLSPFLLAANNGFYEIVEILADNGADINRISQDAEDPYQGVSGTSAIRTASLNQYWDVVSFLMNRDVKLEILLEPCLGNPNGLTDFFEVMRAVGISNENILNDPDEINAFEEVVKERLNLNSEKKEVVQEDETDETIMKNEINEILMGIFFSGVAFLYISFCQITDGEVADTEMKMIFEKMREIGLQTNLNNDQVQNEVEGAIDRFITVNKRYGHPGLLLGFFNIMSKLKNHSAFNKEIAESIYLDLTNLMNADGVQNENEIDVLAYVKREFGLQDQKNTSSEKEKEQEDDNKGYPGISTRVKKMMPEIKRMN